jgi:hypothetical protein
MLPAVMAPLPLSVTASIDGTLIWTLIGLLVVKLPLVPIIRVLPCTCVVTWRGSVVSFRTSWPGRGAAGKVP